MAGMNKNDTNLYIAFVILFFIESLPDIISETALSCCTDERRYEERTVGEAIELI